ncbi:unnamed protein product [Caenorhabditis angaria]|uniref:Uncharacterized protein n=1 Tax=Caenorhabditis angaria TaxID=860376 RepID=A0A9P1I3P4_9PELO|nr:unnamed protein product [Caenorhabditis angaria]
MGHIGEVIHVDEQDVAYEVEVKEDLECIQVAEEYYGGIPSTSEGQYFDYVPVDGDRLIDEEGSEFIFDSATQSYQQIFTEEHQNQEKILLPENIIEEEEVYDEPGPSTSTASEPTKNVYMIKRGGKRKYPDKISQGKLELYNPISFTTSFSESLKSIKGNTNMKKLVKYSQMNTMHPDEVEQVVESGQIMKKLQVEITKLRKENEKLKKENEEVHRNLQITTGKHVEARQANHSTQMYKRDLQKELNTLRQNRKDLLTSTTW